MQILTEKKVINYLISLFITYLIIINKLIKKKKLLPLKYLILRLLKI